MALRNLSIQAMFQISSDWIDPESEAHALLMANPNTAGLMSSIREAHERIADLQSADASEYGELTKSASELDVEHDNLVRGMHGVLTSLQELGGGDEYIELRDFLFPEGLTLVQRSYLEQAGHTALISDSLSDERRELLATISIAGRTLLDSVDEWISVGARLGDIEQQKAKFTQRAPSERGKFNLARLTWIRVTHALSSVMALSELDEQEEAIMFGAMRQAERTADRRDRARTTEGEDPPDGDEASGEDGSSGDGDGGVDDEASDADGGSVDVTAAQ